MQKVIQMDSDLSLLILVVTAICIIILALYYYKIYSFDEVTNMWESFSCDDKKAYIIDKPDIRQYWFNRYVIECLSGDSNNGFNS